VSAPRLVVTVELEGRARVVFDASSREDEQRLRAWLRRSRELETLPALLEGLLDELDERDREVA
jgi:hypothetical protein